MNKTSLLVLIAGTFNGCALAESLTCSLTDTVYFGYSLDHTQAVELCRIKEKNKPVKYKYSFGTINSPEMVIVKEKPFINYNGATYGGFQVENGTFMYSVVNGKNDTSVLYIENEGKIVSMIQIDTVDVNFVTHTFSIMMD